METFAATALSIGILAAIVLTAGGVWLIAKGGDRKKGALMMTAAAVLLANVLIWAV